MGKYHGEEISRFLLDAFGYEGTIEEATQKMVELFTELGVDMYFDGNVTEDLIRPVEISTSFTLKELESILKGCIR